jgi:protoporphyrinogen/coproporphyrinogen III oxidase
VKRVAVVGGGLAGLSCAHALHRRGIDSIVFESGARPGGRDNAVLYLLAPDLFRNTFLLIDQLGLRDEILPISPHAGQVYKGRIYHHRVASAAGLLSFKGLRFTDKAMLPRMAYLLARHSSELDFHKPEAGLEFDKETVASYVKRELSQNVLNYVAGPLISTLFFFGSDETSAWLYLVLAKHMYNVRMSTLRGGITRITECLVEGLQVRINHTVGRVELKGGSYVIDDEQFSDVVIAAPGDAVCSIDGIEAMLSDEDRKFFHDCRYQRVSSVRVRTERPVDGKCYAVAVPRVENLVANTISFHDYLDPSSVQNGEGLLTISGGGSEADPAELTQELHKLYSISPLHTEPFEWKQGMPKFPPGRYREITEFQRRQRRPGLFFCGDYLLGPFIEGAITTGLRTAEAIVARFENASGNPDIDTRV